MDPGSRTRPRWPYFGQPQKLLLGCGLAMWMGSSLPWVIIRPLGFYGRASLLALSWVLWAGLMTMGAAIAPWRLVTLVSSVGGGAVAVYLALWQTWRVFQACPFSKIVRLECVPGPGVVIILAAGAVAMWQGWRLRPVLGPPRPS
ncbi:MAG: hypothetical protein ACRD0O_21095 [Acidimicrobiia bacterium]